MMDPVLLLVLIGLGLFALGCFVGAAGGCNCQKWYDRGHDDGKYNRGTRSVGGWM